MIPCDTHKRRSRHDRSRSTTQEALAVNGALAATAAGAFALTLWLSTPAALDPIAIAEQGDALEEALASSPAEGI